jgi:nucleotide-binding universal stress UspA family protein
MHVLFGYDGSARAEEARDLLAHLELPAGTVITAVTVLQPRSALFELEMVPLDPAEAEARLVDELLDELRTATRAFEAPGRRVEHLILRGRPAGAIIAEARARAVDLIVIGSRGRGPFQSMLLGSVSTEVVHGAPCPVFVARSAGLRRVLFATDGSPASAPALEMLATSPLFQHLPIHVVSVSEPLFSLIAADPGFVSSKLIEMELEAADQRLAARSNNARTAAERLTAAGRVATWAVRTGNPPEEILAAAKEAEADLIVTGSHRDAGSFPRTLGSVARNVLQHAHVSVLVTRSRSAT